MEPATAMIAFLGPRLNSSNCVALRATNSNGVRILRCLTSIQLRSFWWLSVRLQGISYAIHKSTGASMARRGYN
jgi:hypothetical protein